MVRPALTLLAMLLLAACGIAQPGTPGHEPPSAGAVNGVTGEKTNAR